jgi:hypothetical protein
MVATMDVARPYRAVVAGLDGDVLVLLAGISRPLTGRQIAARLGLASHEGVRKSLERLVHQGIVLRESAGNAFLHTLNREHLAAGAVVALAGIRSELWARLRRTLEGWELPAVHASVFGSAARGDGDADSDIDLFIVRPADVDSDDDRWRDQIDALGEQVRAWTGNLLNVIEQDQRALSDLIAQAPPVLDDVRRDGIDLVGEPSRKLLGVGAERGAA